MKAKHQHQRKHILMNDSLTAVHIKRMKPSHSIKNRYAKKTLQHNNL